MPSIIRARGERAGQPDLVISSVRLKRIALGEAVDVLFVV